MHLITAGRLEAVTHLSVTASPGQLLISWEAPFTLNLTEIDYSITYCINIVDGSGKNYLSVCNISETHYIFRSDLKIQFIIIVTPENGAGRGTEAKTSAYTGDCQH